MRRPALALAVCLVATVPGAGHARPHLPALAGHNVVVAHGPSALVVRLDQEATIDFRSPHGRGWFDSFKTRGGWAGVAVQEMTPDRHGQQFGHLQLFVPGCDGQFSCVGNTPTWYRLRGSPGGLPEKMTLEKGTYRVYVLADPGTKVEVRFELSGVPGRARLRATTPVTASLVSNGETSFTGAGHAVGKITGRLEGRGLVIGGQWFRRNEPPYGFYSVSCFRRGRGENDPLNTCGTPPEPEPLVTGPATTFLWKNKSTWTYNYRMAMVGSVADAGHMGGFGLFFTFL